MMWSTHSRRINLRDFKPELEQFAVDAWRAPKRIFDAHPPAAKTNTAINAATANTIRTRENFSIRANVELARSSGRHQRALFYFGGCSPGDESH